MTRGMIIIVLLIKHKKKSKSLKNQREVTKQIKKYIMEINNGQIKVLRNKTKQGYLLALLFILSGGLLNLYFVLASPSKPLLSLFVNIILLLSCIITVYLKNRNIYKDLKDRTLFWENEQVLKKEDLHDYEVGSGALYIPVLGDLFPKLWGLPMNRFSKYKICVQSREIDVDKKTYDKLNENDLVTLCYAKHSKVFLGVIVND